LDGNNLQKFETVKDFVEYDEAKEQTSKSLTVSKLLMTRKTANISRELVFKHM